MLTPIQLQVNYQTHTVEVDPSTPLLYVLRNQLALNGPKYGCGVQQCGACMVLIDGKAQPSCMLPVDAVKKQHIITLEGIAAGFDNFHPVQEAFVTEQAAQCGYCLNGMVMQACALLEENPKPDDTAIRNALQRSLCRCGTYARIVRAVKRASEGRK